MMIKEDIKNLTEEELRNRMIMDEGEKHADLSVYMNELDRRNIIKESEKSRREEDGIIYIDPIFISPTNVEGEHLKPVPLSESIGYFISRIKLNPEVEKYYINRIDSVLSDYVNKEVGDIELQEIKSKVSNLIKELSFQQKIIIKELTPFVTINDEGVLIIEMVPFLER